MNRIFERQPVVDQIVAEAHAEILRKYGGGTGDGERPLAYHGLHHTQDVEIAMRFISLLAFERGKISLATLDLASIAPAIHDEEQDLGPGANEEACGEIASVQMHKSGFFNETEIIRTAKAIMGTTVSVENGYVVQHPGDDYLCKLMADADLSSLGRPPRVYWYWAEALLKELKQTEQPSEEDCYNFLKNQIPLLENHRFFTEEANEVFYCQDQNLEFVRNKIFEIGG